MQFNFFPWVTTLASALTASICFGGSFLEQSPKELSEVSDGILIGEIQATESYQAEDGSIRTRFVVISDESIRGQFPPAVWISIPGGTFQKMGVYDSSRINPKGWTRGLFLVEENKYGLSVIEGAYGAIRLDSPNDEAQIQEGLIGDLRNLSAGQSSPDFSPYVPTHSFDYATSATGLTGSEENGARRFQRPDRLVPIPVIYDASLLPSGITKAQAITALENALNAWETASSIQFNIVGEEIFPESVRSYSDGSNEVLRIQFHDKFDDIDGSTLGIGGNSFFADLGAGGTVKGLPFVEVVRGYVYLAHDSSTMEDPINFEEVLTHEIGHAIGLAHSSETSPEPDNFLKDAIMYYLVQADGRGADLRQYDVDTVRKAYPIDNIPPFAISQDVVVVTTSGNFGDERINRFEVGGGDVDSSSLSVELVDDDDGVFSINANNVDYVDPAPYGDNEASNGGAFFRFKYRLDDGVNKSGFGTISVVKTRRDTGTDGLPDSWSNQYFNTTDTSNNRGPFDDFDGDGVFNYYEFRAGTDPTIANPPLIINSISEDFITYTAEADQLYLLEATVDFNNWNLKTYTTPNAASNNASFSIELDANGKTFYRIRRLD